ncbi:hypothetical protein TNCV_4953131 [Trichonephila clavipes]|nr:hypothetical protein TNCV_4953131 [Trichonephila clavipes]
MISSDSHVEILYEGQRSIDRSSRSQLGKFKVSRKTSSEQHNGHKSSKSNAGWGSVHRDQKRPTPEPKQGIKRAIPSSVSSRNHKYRRPNNPSPGDRSPLQAAMGILLCIDEARQNMRKQHKNWGKYYNRKGGS